MGANMKKSEIPFDILKKNCKREFVAMLSDSSKLSKFSGIIGITFLANRLSNNPVGNKQLLEEIKEEGLAFIDRVDVRSFNGLLSAFPDVFPPWIREGGYKIEYTDRGYILFRA